MRHVKEIEELTERIKLIREDINKNFLDIRQAISKALTLNYLLIISKHLLEEMETLIDSLECGRARVKEINCKEMFKTKVRDYTTEVGASYIDRAISDIGKFSNFADQRLTDPYYPEDCKKCLKQLKPALSLQKRMIESISILESNHGLRIDVSDIRNLDERRIFQEVIRPVSHIQRLKIMKSILEGKCRFSELVDASKLQSGHLIYHLRILEKHDLIIHDTAKNYIVSPKGYWILAALKQTIEETKNQNDTSLTLSAN